MILINNDFVAADFSLCNLQLLRAIYRRLQVCSYVIQVANFPVGEREGYLLMPSNSTLNINT